MTIRLEWYIELFIELYKPFAKDINIKDAIFYCIIKFQDAIFIPINAENSFNQGREKFKDPQKQTKEPKKFSHSHDQTFNSNKAQSSFRSEKLKGREQTSKPGKPKTPEPTAQVLPYDFRPGNLNIFGEINDKDKIQDLKNIDNVPQDDFKYESETDLESIVKVPSEYSSGKKYLGLRI